MNTIQQIKGFFSKCQYIEAYKRLSVYVQEEPTAINYGLLGLTLFHLEKYQESCSAYKKALELDKSNEEFRYMLNHVEQNAFSKVNVPVPDINTFSKDDLLSPNRTRENNIPESRSNLFFSSSLVSWLLTAGCKFIGFFINKIVFIVVFIYGRLFGYKDKIWTNWYKRSMFFSILTLVVMRDYLDKRCLYNVYSKKVLVGFYQGLLKQPPGVRYFRTANGSWNNLKNPLDGAAGTRFQRNTSSEAIQVPHPDDILLPNPREISRRLLTRKSTMEKIPFLNMLSVSWIQFMVHGWVSHGPDIPQDSEYNIELHDDDPIRKMYGIDKFSVGKTETDPTRMKHCGLYVIGPYTHHYPLLP